MMKLKKQFKKEEANLDESPKFELIFQTCNPCNSKFRFNKKAQFSANLILKDEIAKKKLN